MLHFTFKGVLIHNQQTVNLHLFTKGGFVWWSAAGEEFAGAHAAGKGLEEHLFMNQDRRTQGNEEKPNQG